MARQRDAPRKKSPSQQRLDSKAQSEAELHIHKEALCVSQAEVLQLHNQLEAAARQRHVRPCVG